MIGIDGRKDHQRARDGLLIIGRLGPGGKTQKSRPGLGEDLGRAQEGETSLMAAKPADSGNLRLTLDAISRVVLTGRKADVTRTTLVPPTIGPPCRPPELRVDPGLHCSPLGDRFVVNRWGDRARFPPKATYSLDEGF